MTVKLPARRRVLFALLCAADGVFLALVGAAANAAMYLAHSLGWNTAIAMPLGMVLAMAVQTALALGASPCLGPIESMVPSMLVAMFGPMVICASCLAGHHLGRSAALIFGVASGILAFVFLRAGGWYYRRRLKRAFPGG